jgi:hypothetical protein
MPDPYLILKSIGLAAVAAAFVLLVLAWPWRRAHPVRSSFAALLGIALGFLVGAWWLGILPSWPPKESQQAIFGFRPPAEDQDRLWFVVLPAVFIVELIGSLLGRRQWLVWPLRFLVAVAAAPILLHGSVYVSGNVGPDSRAWTHDETLQIFGGLALALLLVWAALSLLMRRVPGRSVPLAASIATGGTAVIMMLSGYASGGQIGLPLAAALGGAAVGGLLLAGPPDLRGVLGVGLVGLFSLLVMGRFFAELNTRHAALLFFGLLLCWLPELFFSSRSLPRLRGVLRVALAAAPVVVAAVFAYQEFAKASASTSPDSPEPSAADYEAFGK